MLCCSKKKLEKMIGTIIENTVKKEMEGLTDWCDELQGQAVDATELSVAIAELRAQVSRCDAQLQALADAFGLRFELQ